MAMNNLTTIRADALPNLAGAISKADQERARKRLARRKLIETLRTL